MKSRIFVALAVGIVLSLASFTATAQKDAPLRKSVMADTGIVSLGQGQVLRVTLDWGDGSAEAVVRFRRIEYSQGICNGGLCPLALSSQTTSAPLRPMPAKAPSMTLISPAFA